MTIHHALPVPQAPFARIRWLTTLALLLVAGLSARAQLVTSVSQTYSVPRTVDGGSTRIAFDFSSSLPPLGTMSLVRSVISTTFGKAPDLSDDPPFYSEIGFVLRELGAASNLLGAVTLIDTGSFNDGDFGDSFHGTITFDDRAASAVNADPDHLVSGTFQPVEPLSAFSVYSPFWQLELDDATTQNPLTFTSATLTLFTRSAVPGTADPVPESSTITLGGTGVLVLAVCLRRRQRSQG